MAVTFMGSVAFPAVLGNNATVQHLCAIENGVTSRVNVRVRRLAIQCDTLAALTSVMPQAEASRGVGISGGVLLDKAAFSTLQSSDAGVVIRSALGTGSAIDATRGTRLWQQYIARLHTAAEQVLGADESVVPRLIESGSFNLVLRPGESLLVSVLGASTASNAALSTNWAVNCVWEEDSIATFAISGTVTLSGSPVSGAIVTVVEADDADMTNAHVREVITTGAGGTWASTIRTGKVGAAFVQYEAGGTKYTAPGSPYLA